MTGSAIPTTGRRPIHPAWESISLETQSAPLRCALALRMGPTGPGQPVIFVAPRYSLVVAHDHIAPRVSGLYKLKGLTKEQLQELYDKYHKTNPAEANKVKKWQSQWDSVARR
jgi:hypothetical protein